MSKLRPNRARWISSGWKDAPKMDRRDRGKHTHAHKHKETQVNKARAEDH